MKNCPFCKKSIKGDATKCTFCGQTLVEKISIGVTSFHNTYTPPSSKTKKETAHTYYAPPKRPYSAAGFKMPKINGWMVSIIGSLALTALLNYHGNSNPLPAPTPADTSAVNSTSRSDTASVPSASYRQLANGTVLSAGFWPLSGDGVLTITNGSDSDAILKLITNSGKKAYSVYIRKNGSYSIKNINDGVYRVIFSFGADWDSSLKKFLVSPRAEAFDDNFNFHTSDSQYTTYTITLNPVVDGKATTSSIDQSEFDKY